MGVSLPVVPPMSPPVNFTLVAEVKLKRKYLKMFRSDLARTYR